MVAYQFYEQFISITNDIRLPSVIIISIAIIIVHVNMIGHRSIN